MANPALSNSPAFKSDGPAQGVDSLQDLYDAPAATTRNTGRMSYEDTAVKTLTLFVVLLATGVVGWSLPGLATVGAIVGLVLGLVNSFKREPSVPLIVAYAAAQGVFLGGISAIFDARFNGIVLQAVLATLVTFGVTLALFANGKVRVSPKMNKIFLIGAVSLILFNVLNLVLVVAGVGNLRMGGLGLLISAVAVFLAAYSLVMDFDFIKEGTRSGLPAKYGWTAAFGLMVTLVWLYLELLRIVAILRGDE